MPPIPGAESRPAVVLLHSSGLSGRQWGRLSEVLGRSHRVIAPDFLGSGENPPWPAGRPFDLSMDVDVIERLLVDLRQPAHLVGHSYGGLIALILARRAPERVRSLAVYDPVAFGVLHDAGDEEGLTDLMRVGGHPVFLDEEIGGGDAWFEVFVDYWNGPGAWRAMSESGREAFLRVGRKVFLEVRSLGSDRTPRSAYARVGAPSLVLEGERSPIAARRVVRLLASALPQGREATVPGAGHMGPLTHAALVNQAIVDHIISAEAP
jgi:pimeloyl-ACP methyl ester carboxylesterase